MVEMFLLMAVGYLLGKIGMLDAGSSKKITAIVVNVANPAMIIASCANKERESGSMLLVCALLSAGIYIYLFAVSFLLPRLLRVPRKDRGTYEVMTIFSNIGFLGLPLILSVYGETAVLYATLFLFPYNVLIYTLGIRLLQKGSGTGEKKSFSLREIFNIGTCSAILALLLYLFGVPVPGAVSGTLTYLSNLSAPLSMILIGYSMTTFPIRELFTDRRLILFSLIRLLLVPLLAMLLIRQLVSDQNLLGVCLIMLATPVGSMTAMMAELYGGDEALAGKGVALSTALSVATIPALSLLLGL
ncbi:MAG: AEC family transporter [Lachnospiraceae bacterium]